MYDNSLGRMRRPRRRGLRGLGLLQVSPDFLTGALVSVVVVWVAKRGLTLPFTKKSKAS